MKTLLRWLISAAIVYCIPYFVEGIWVKNFMSAIIASLVIGLFNTFLKPLLALLSLPIVILTFGLALLVINALLLWLAGSMLEGFEVNGFMPALYGSFIISIVTGIAQWVFGLKQ